MSLKISICRVKQRSRAPSSLVKLEFSGIPLCRRTCSTKTNTSSRREMNSNYSRSKVLTEACSVSPTKCLNTMIRTINQSSRP